MTGSLAGTSFIGFGRSVAEDPFVRARVPGSSGTLEPLYRSAAAEEVERALTLAAEAFPRYSALPGVLRGEFLRAIAVEIERVADEIVARGTLETALPEERLQGEIGRTAGHLRMFAELAEDESWVDARIERADPVRKPVPRVDLRSMWCPLGPVAVFCAGNFPLAYSVAGGDSVSAWAAGCPVVVIAHESHPGVAEIVGAAVVRAALATGMPEGVFSLLYGGGRTVGQAVVGHPAIRSVGFTGSRTGGLALMEIAARRPQPIPVYAEMSSVNPVVILPGALEQGEEALSEAFFHSLTQGVGQFCTNPGLVFLPDGCGAVFLECLAERIRASVPGMMLHAGIHDAFDTAKARVVAADGVKLLAASDRPAGPGEGSPAVFTVPVAAFLVQPFLQHEMFGPATLIVRGDLAEIEAALPHLEGQLTASLHATDAELAAHAGLVAALKDRAGRLIFNGFPTGVQVGPAIVHGGPFPATSDGRSTSVGTRAIFRFCRPVAWQGFPDAALPPHLQDANPLGIARME